MSKNIDSEGIFAVKCLCSLCENYDIVIGKGFHLCSHCSYKYEQNRFDVEKKLKLKQEKMIKSGELRKPSCHKHRWFLCLRHLHGNAYWNKAKTTDKKPNIKKSKLKSEKLEGWEKFICVECKKEYRRIPLSGQCKCGGELGVCGE